MDKLGNSRLARSSRGCEDGIESAPAAPRHYKPENSTYVLEAAMRIAGHADSRTTKLYDRRGQKILLENMERIRY